MKLTKAAFNALAFKYLTGSMPSYLRWRTLSAVLECLEYYEGTLAGHKLNMQRVKAEHFPLLETHKMVKAVRALEVQGWKLRLTGTRHKVRLGVDLQREIEGHVEETSVYPDGLQGRVFSRKRFSMVNNND